MIKEDKSILKKEYLYMGIDFGDKKIGFAIGQLITTKSTPIKIVHNHKDKVNWIEIEDTISSWKPNVIIIGYPYALSRNSFMKRLDIFIEDLTKKYEGTIQILTFSEVLSTEESKVLYGDMRKSNYNISKKEDLDDLSASIILQSWFNENMIR